MSLLKKLIKIGVIVLFVILNFLLIKTYDVFNNESMNQPETSKNSISSNQSSLSQSSSLSIEDALQMQRQKIAEEMEHYDANNIKNLVPEKGGKPMRSIIVSSWRTGSTFLGDVLDALPGNFYHNEPLRPFGTIQIRDLNDSYGSAAIERVTKLLKCNYTDLETYIFFAEERKLIFRNDMSLKLKCDLFPKFCYDSKFIESYCKLFPMQNMKLVRLRLKLASSLLRDSSLNVRIVLLVRDPRGSMVSRKDLKWCTDFSDCGNSTNLCQDMVDDHAAAVELVKEFPKTFKVVRYEDFSLAPDNSTREIFQFYGLSFDKRVSEFLDTHTKGKKGGDYSTFRDSKSVCFKWVEKLPFNDAKSIQDSCNKAMRLWGYKAANNEKELKENFNPLLPLTGFDSV